MVTIREMIQQANIEGYEVKSDTHPAQRVTQICSLCLFFQSAQKYLKLSDSFLRSNH